jgi:hypothetical protein
MLMRLMFQKQFGRKFKSIEQQNASAGVKFIIADDSTDNTIAAVNSVVFDLILAVILVSLVMLLFLRSFRNSIDCSRCYSNIFGYRFCGNVAFGLYTQFDDFTRNVIDHRYFGG